MDLDERVDEVGRQTAPRLLGSRDPAGARRSGRSPSRYVHDVERDAEDTLVLADRHDRRQARESGLAESELEPRLTHDVVRGRRQRRTGRAPEREAARVPLEQEREVRPAAFADPLRAHVTRAEPVLVEERPHPVEHEQGRLRQPFGLGRGLDDVAR